MRQLVLKFFREQIWDNIVYALLCIFACWLSAMSEGASGVMFPGFLLQLCWIHCLPDERDGDSRVFLALPVRSSSWALARWVMLVALPLAVLALTAGMYIVLAIEIGGTCPPVSRIVLMVLHTGTWLSVAFALNAVLCPGWAGRTLGIAFAVVFLAMIFLPSTLDHLADTRPDWRFIKPLIQWTIITGAILGPVFLCVSFSFRQAAFVDAMKKVRNAGWTESPAPLIGHPKPVSHTRRWIQAFLLSTETLFGITAGIFLILWPLFDIKNASFPFTGALLFIFMGGRSWTASWSRSVRVIASLPMTKRRVAILATVFSSTFMLLTPFLVASVWHLEHLWIGRPSVTTITTFGAAIPLMAAVGVVWLATYACPESFWRTGVAWEGIIAFGMLVVLVTALTLGLSGWVVILRNYGWLFCLGLVMLPYGIWLMYHLLRNSLDNSEFFRKVSAE